MSLRTVVFYGSVRSARKGILAARYITRLARERGHEVTLLDAAELKLPLLDLMYRRQFAVGFRSIATLGPPS